MTESCRRQFLTYFKILAVALAVWLRDPRNTRATTEPSDNDEQEGDTKRVSNLPIREIFIHCSATTEDMDVGAEEIDRWHRRRGWRGIGYHYVIRRDGTLQTGRAHEQRGAHARRHNKNSLGICLIGGLGDDGRGDPNFTPEQWERLGDLLRGLKRSYPNAKVRGHNEVAAKACPSFDVQHWLATGEVRPVY